MTEWYDFLSFAICHQYAMQFAQIAIDPMAMMQAMAQVRQQTRSLDRVIQGPFDSSLISPR